MHNLTANAIKALQHTSNARIEWKAWRENGKIFLSIADNGPGVPADHLKALFDETAVSGSRHGLGLHIIRDLAKAIGCNISFHRDTAGATVFVLAT